MEFNETREKILEEKNKNKVLVASHRGTNGGSIVQNTILAYKNALMHGADIIEMDVIRSTDGVFYALHDGVEKQVFQFDKDIRTMSSSEIESYPIFNSLGIPMDSPLCRMDDVLETFKGKCLINVDRSWFYWEDVIRQLNRHNMFDQIILKSHVDDKLLETLQELGGKLMYMPILKNEDDFNAEMDQVMNYKLNVIAAEVLVMSDKAAMTSQSLIERLHKQDILAWVNSLTLCEKLPIKILDSMPNEVKSNSEVKAMLSMFENGKRISFCNGYDDNTAIAEDPKLAWGKLIDMGFDVIQTDWPALVKKFVAENY